MNKIQHSIILSMMSLVGATTLHAATIVNLHQASPGVLSAFTFTTSARMGVAGMAAATSSPVNELRALPSLPSAKVGKLHHRYQQYYRGVLVAGRQVIAHSTGNSATNYSGQLVKNLEKDLVHFQSAPLWSLSDAKKSVYQNYHAEQIEAGDKLMSDHGRVVIFIDDKHIAHQAYRLEYFILGEKPSKPVYIIDVNTKQILMQYDNLQTAAPMDIAAKGPGGNAKTGAYLYGETPKHPLLSIQKQGVQCQMNNKSVKTIDFSTIAQKDPNELDNLDFEAAPAVHFSCSERDTYNHKDRVINGAYGVEDDAQYFGNVIVNMYRDWYQLSPLGKKLNMVIHIPKYENAFWDGRAMWFGDGKDMLFPLVALDVTAHEVTHGFTEFNSGLEAHDQPGSLNEAFSDMAGKAAEFYAYGSVSWALGGDVIKRGKGVVCDATGSEGMRCMNDPKRDPMGIGIDNAREYDGMVDKIHEMAQAVIDRNNAVEAEATRLATLRVDAEIAEKTIAKKDRRKYIARYKAELLRDHSEEINLHLLNAISQGAIVHTGNGVFNKAFYLLANKPGWDVHSAFDVMVYANQNYWTPTSDFADAANGVYQSAIALNRNVDDVRDVFQQVGIEIPTTATT